MNSTCLTDTLRFGSYLLRIASFLVIFSVVPHAHAQFDRNLDWSVRQLSDNGQGQAGTPVIAADDFGGVHVFWPQGGDAADASTALYYAYSDGIKWSKNDVIVGGIQTSAVTIDSYDTLRLVWKENDGSLRYSYASISAAASARGWAEPAIIVDGPAFYPDLLFDPRGILHVAYSYIADTSALYYMRSADGGRSWSRPTVFEAPRSDAATNSPQMAIGEDGTLHMVWSLMPTSNFYGGLGVYYARSTDAGETWSNPVRLDEETPDALSERAWMASIAVVGSNEVHVVWDAHAQAGRRYHQWSRDGGLTWTSPEPIWGSFVSQTGPNPMVVDSAGTLYLLSAGTFKWGQRQGVYFSRWTGSNWTDPLLVDLSSDGPHFIQVAITEGNTLHVVWQARRADPKGVWYASARTTAPHVAPQPAPQIEVKPTVPPATPTSTITPTATLPGAAPTPTISQAGNMRIPSNPQYAIMAGVLPVALLIGIVILSQTVWPRKRSRQRRRRSHK